MVQRIRRNLDWLNNDEQSCRRVAIVAHSQGAALCHDLLRSGALRPDDPSTCSSRWGRACAG